MQLSIGYPDRASAIAIMKSQSADNPLDSVEQAADAEIIMQMQKAADQLYTDDKIYTYVAALCEETRGHPLIRLGISPRGSLSICAAARARAFIQGRDFVIPEDVKAMALPALAHRYICEEDNDKAKKDRIVRLLQSVPVPTEDWRRR